jgi:D-glycero-D-manno-heptose 1,7-bisphosphate phosphatase
MPLTTAILDRDGTINLDPGYLDDPAALALIPNAAAGMKRLQELGLRLIVVSNQSGIGRGLFTWATLEAVHDRFKALLAAEGVTLSGIFICPHHPDDNCGCRKPKPGLVERAATMLNFDPREAVVIGDKASDIGLARAVGALAVLVRTGDGEAALRDNANPDIVAADLFDAARQIEAHMKERNDP